MEKLLSSVEENCFATIVKVTETDEFLKRLEEYGLVKGEKIKVIKKAPKSQVFLISIRGFALCIDKETCGKVVVSD